MNADFLLFATDAAQPNLILTVVALLAVFGLPCLMILLTRKVKFFKIVGAVALCYVFGLCVFSFGAKLRQISRGNRRLRGLCA